MRIIIDTKDGTRIFDTNLIDSVGFVRQDSWYNVATQQLINYGSWMFYVNKVKLIFDTEELANRAREYILASIGQ